MHISPSHLRYSHGCASSTSSLKGGERLQCLPLADNCDYAGICPGCENYVLLQ